MMIRGYAISARLIAMIVGALALLIVTALFVRSCDKRRSEAAQSRVERSQSDALSNSAGDAIDTVSASGKAEAASEDLTRSNEKDIRNAEGANERVGAGVNNAGLLSLCRRAAYRDSERCKLLRAPAR